jgi:hypothetical protein
VRGASTRRADGCDGGDSISLKRPSRIYVQIALIVAVGVEAIVLPPRGAYSHGGPRTLGDLTGEVLFCPLLIILLGTIVWLAGRIGVGRRARWRQCVATLPVTMIAVLFTAVSAPLTHSLRSTNAPSKLSTAQAVYLR